MAVCVRVGGPRNLHRATQLLLSVVSSPCQRASVWKCRCGSPHACAQVCGRVPEMLCGWASSGGGRPTARAWEVCAPRDRAGRVEPTRVRVYVCLSVPVVCVFAGRVQNAPLLRVIGEGMNY